MRVLMYVFPCSPVDPFALPLSCIHVTFETAFLEEERVEKGEKQNWPSWGWDILRPKGRRERCEWILSKGLDGWGWMRGISVWRDISKIIKGQRDRVFYTAQCREEEEEMEFGGSNAKEELNQGAVSTGGGCIWEFWVWTWWRSWVVSYRRY